MELGSVDRNVNHAAGFYARAAIETTDNDRPILVIVTCKTFASGPVVVVFDLQGIVYRYRLHWHCNVNDDLLTLRLRKYNGTSKNSRARRVDLCVFEMFGPYAQRNCSSDTLLQGRALSEDTWRRFIFPLGERIDHRSPPPDCSSRTSTMLIGGLPMKLATNRLASATCTS